MNIEKIETNRLYLRPFTKDDALFAISIWNDPEMGEYLGDPALETIDPEYVKEIEALGDDPICCYLIAESKTTGNESEPAVLSLWKIKLYMILPTVSTNYTGAKAMPQR